MNKRTIRIAIGAIISLAFMAGAFYEINLREFIAAFRDINLFALLLCIACFGASCIVRAYMWRITTSAVGEIGFSKLFGGIMVGYMINNILPLRAGELYRAYYLASHTGASRTYILSTVFIERIFDVFSLGLLLMAGLFFGIHGLSFNGARIVIAVWVLLVLVMLFFLLSVDRLRTIRGRMSFVPERVLHILNNFFSPLARLNQSGKIACLLVLNFVVWMFNYCAVLALVYQVVPLKFESAALLFLFINLGLLIPSTPGGLGVMQLAFWMALSQCGVPREGALALSFAYQAGAFFFTIAAGLPYFLHSHMRLGGIPQEVGLDGPG